MRVLILTPKKNGASCRWRIQQLLPGLRDHGIQGVVEEIPNGNLARLAQAKTAANYDVVVLQKRLLTRHVLLRLRRYAPRLVFEFDEVLNLKRHEDGIRPSVTRDRRFGRTLQLADAVIASNDILGDQARQLVPDPKSVSIIPTVVDLDRWAARPIPQQGQANVLGWFGSASLFPQLDVVKPALIQLFRHFDNLSLRLLCDKPFPIDGVVTEHHRVTTRSEVREVQGFDIALAPYVEDACTRGGTSPKLLACFAAGIPVVASDIEIHRAFITDGENGFLCGTLQEWVEAMGRLISDPQLRNQMGQAGRRRLENSTLMNATILRYAEFFRRVAATAPVPVAIADPSLAYD